MTRKELQEAYKNIKFKMGVFQIRNTANGKVFIEGSTNLDKIWNRHQTQLNFGSHRNTVLQEEWNTFGEHSFVYEILGEVQQNEAETLDMSREIKLLEKMYIEELQPFGDKGYHKKSFVS